MKDILSYQAHNAHYVKQTAEEVRPGHLKNAADLAYRPANPLGRTLDAVGDSLIAGVDIGSGHGWAAGFMADRLEKVYAIEPSEAAHDVARELYKHHEHITWLNGFAEDLLPNIKLEGPTLFVSNIVLSHLEDESVIAIIQAINGIAKPGSMLSFNENWGADYHERLWHARTSDWWREQFEGWDITFGKSVPSDISNAFKGFIGVKR